MAYINKESIVDFITKGLNNPDKTKAFGHDAVEILTEIEYAPAADVVEVKHGEWITLEAEIGLYSCSLCEHKILRAECNYCPKCGAKMDGGVTDEQV